MPRLAFAVGGLGALLGLAAASAINSACLRFLHAGVTRLR
jgi:hypothetical protein